MWSNIRYFVDQMSAVHAVLLNLSEVLLLTDRLFGLMFNCVHSLGNFH